MGIVGEGEGREDLACVHPSVGEGEVSDKKVWGVLAVLGLLVIVNSVILLSMTFHLQSVERFGDYPQSQAFPSFLSKAPNNHYMIAYVKDNCVIQLTLRQGVGGIWFEDGHVECPTSASNLTAAQGIINQQLTEHKGMCFYFYKWLNGTETLRYSTNENCNAPWHSIVVSP